MKNHALQCTSDHLGMTEPSQHVSLTTCVFIEPIYTCAIVLFVKSVAFAGMGLVFHGWDVAHDDGAMAWAAGICDRKVTVNVLGRSHVQSNPNDVYQLVMKGLLGLTDVQWWMVLTAVVLGIAFVLGMCAGGKPRRSVGLALGLAVGGFGWLVLDLEGGLGSFVFGFILSPLASLLSIRLGACAIALIRKCH